MIKIKKNKIKKYKKRFILFFKNQLATVNKTPVIVLGNQKSGTSAIAHLLADFGGLSKTVDIPPLWDSTVIEIIKGHIEFLHIVNHHKFYFSKELIKEPNMTFFAPQVMEVFPESRCVFVIRDPRDNIRSLLNRIKIPGHLKEIDKLLLQGIREGYKLILNAKRWEIDQAENYIGVLSHRWNKAVDNYLLCKDRMILIKYEDFLVDKYRFIADLANQLGIRQKADIADKLDIQYQPRGIHNVSWQEFFGQENLARIERICGSRMKEFGYSNKTSV